MNYSLIIPVYNEQKTLPKLLKKLNSFNKIIEIIFIDDGSTDKTNEILKANALRFKLIVNKKNLGKGASIRKGILAATKKNIFFFDGDLEIDTASIPKLIENFEFNNYDAMLGIRWERFEFKSIGINRIGNFLINEIFNLVHKTNFSDILCCVKIIKSDILKSFKLNSNNFEIESEIMSYISLKNLNYFEQKVHYTRRNSSQGKKLRYSDTWSILRFIFTSKNYI